MAGARLMVWNGYGFDDVIKVFLSIAFAGIAAQLVGIRLADLAKAKAALARLSDGGGHRHHGYGVCEAHSELPIE